MTSHHPLHGDHLNIELFRYLCRLNRITDSGTLPFLVPDTVVFTNARATQWFSFDPESGTLGRRNAKQLDRSVIFSEFSAINKGDKSEICACFTTFHDCRLQSLYFSEKTLHAFLFGPSGGPSEELVALTSAPGGGGSSGGGGGDASAAAAAGGGLSSSSSSSAPRIGILQKFIEPNKDNNEVFQVAWSPRMTYILRRFSKRRLIDRLAEPLARAATFDGPSTLSEEVFTGPGTKSVIEPFVKALVDHVRGADSGRYTVGRCLLFFKVDRLGQMWFTYCTSMRIVVDEEDRNASMLLAAGGSGIAPSRSGFLTKKDGHSDGMNNDQDDQDDEEEEQNVVLRRKQSLTSGGGGLIKAGGDGGGGGGGKSNAALYGSGGKDAPVITSGNVVTPSHQIPTIAQLERAQIIPHPDSPLAALMGLDEARINALAERVQAKITAEHQQQHINQQLQLGGAAAAAASLSLLDNAAALRSAYQIRKPGAAFPKQGKEEERYPVRMRARWDRNTLESLKFTPPPVKPHLEPLILSLQRQENHSGVDLSEAWDSSEGGATADHERLLYLLSLPGPLSKRELVRSRKVGVRGAPQPPGWEETREKMFPRKKSSGSNMLLRESSSLDCRDLSPGAGQLQPQQHDEKERSCELPMAVTSAMPPPHSSSSENNNNKDADNNNSASKKPSARAGTDSPSPARHGKGGHHHPVAKHFRYARTEIKKALRIAAKDDVGSEDHHHHVSPGSHSNNNNNNSNKHAASVSSSSSAFHHRKILAGEGMPPQLLARFLTPSIDVAVERSQLRIEAMEARKQELAEEQRRVREEMKRMGITAKTTATRHGSAAAPVATTQSSSSVSPAKRPATASAVSNSATKLSVPPVIITTTPAAAAAEASEKQSDQRGNGNDNIDSHREETQQHHATPNKSGADATGGDESPHRTYEDDFEATPQFKTLILDEQQQQQQQPHLPQAAAATTTDVTTTATAAGDGRGRAASVPPSESHASLASLGLGAAKSQRPASMANSFSSAPACSTNPSNDNSPRSRAATMFAHHYHHHHGGGNNGQSHIVIPSSGKSASTLPPHTQFSDTFIVAMKLHAGSSIGAASRDVRAAEAAVSTVAEALNPGLVALRENVRLESKFAPQRVARELTLLETKNRNKNSNNNDDAASVHENIFPLKDHAAWILDARVVGGARTAGIWIVTHEAAVAAAEAEARREQEERAAVEQRAHEEAKRRERLLVLQQEAREAREKREEARQLLLDTETTSKNNKRLRKKSSFGMATESDATSNATNTPSTTARGAARNQQQLQVLAITDAVFDNGDNVDDNALESDENQSSAVEENTAPAPAALSSSANTGAPFSAESAAFSLASESSPARSRVASGENNNNSNVNVNNSSSSGFVIDDEFDADERKKKREEAEEESKKRVHIILEVLRPLVGDPRVSCASDGRMMLRRFSDEALGPFRHAMDEEEKKYTDIFSFFAIVRTDIAQAGGIVTPRTRAQNEKVQQQILMQQQLSAKQVLLMQVPRGPYHVMVPGVPRSVAESLLDPRGGRSSRSGLGASQLAAARSTGSNAAKNAAAVAEAISRKNSVPQRKGGMTKAELRAHITCVVLRTCFGALEEFKRKYKGRLGYLNASCCYVWDEEIAMAVLGSAGSGSGAARRKQSVNSRTWKEDQVFEPMHPPALAMQSNDGGKWWFRRI